MTTSEKLLEKAIKSPQNLKYKEFETLLGQHGYIKERQTGSHAMWRAARKPRMCIQNDSGKAKSIRLKNFWRL
jgi:predicted RNA binding protein YcfA (HicA-like mRNA interferase family)